MARHNQLRILFISHESSMSGAPILLLNLLKLLQKHRFAEITLVIRRGGALDDLFKPFGKVLIIKGTDYQKGKNIIRKVLDFIAYRKRVKVFKKLAKNADLIISNTITNGRLLKELLPLKIPVITYVHELKDVMTIFDEKGDTSLSISLSKAFLSPSKAVTENLVANYKVSSSDIYPLNYFFECPSESLINTKAIVRKQAYAKYNIPLNAFTVVGMGAGAYRKGIDLFVDIANEVLKTDTGFHFIWIGDFIEEVVRAEVMQKIEKFNLHKYITITGFVPPASDNLLPFDVLALTSREDPYPLVVIEAAFLKIPSICFDKTGGMVDFISDQAGFVVAPGEIENYAKTIIELKNDPRLIEQKGMRAREKAVQLHSNEVLILDQLNKCIRDVFSVEGEA